MSKDKSLVGYLKWTYNEPKHPTELLGDFTWKTGIEMTIAGPKLKFDENTTLSQWRDQQIEKWELLTRNFKKDKKILALDVVINPTKDDVEEVESDSNFIKWVD